MWSEDPKRMGFVDQEHGLVTAGDLAEARSGARSPSILKTDSVTTRKRMAGLRATAARVIKLSNCSISLCGKRQSFARLSTIPSMIVAWTSRSANTTSLRPRTEESTPTLARQPEPKTIAAG